MKTKIYIGILLCAYTHIATAQTQKLIVEPNIQLPSDSTLAKQLIVSLDQFLNAAQGENEKNNCVFEAEKIETFILLDEIYGIERSEKYKDNFFYKPYLTGIIPLEKNTFLLSIAYMGAANNKPILAASFELVAHQTNSSFLFSSPLVRNTKHWKKTTVDNNVFYYQDSINSQKLNEYTTLCSTFDKKLKIANKQCTFYLCENFVDVQKTIGVTYKLMYNGYSENVLSSFHNNTKLIVMGSNDPSFNNFDPHDLWHDRLSLVVARERVNKPIDEGCAYLYGGSWGLSWSTIFELFMTKVASNKKADWISYKENPFNFSSTDATHLMVDYVVNALLIQKIESEKGFEAVWEFLLCGPYQKGNENYYRTLEKLTGIKKSDYSKMVWKLIAEENRKLQG